MNRYLALFSLWFLPMVNAHAEFHQDFQNPSDRAGALSVWHATPGAGEATSTLEVGSDYLRMKVDSTQDRRGVWWSIMGREISQYLDLETLAQPGHELRVKVRVRISHAPRRINLTFNTQRTTDFHQNKLQYEIPTAGEWHTITFTTTHFDGRPGDRVNVELAMIDWGHDHYHTDIGEISAMVVDPVVAGPDIGDQTPYHAPVPPLNTFKNILPVAQDAVVDTLWHDFLLNQWEADSITGAVPALSVNGTQWTILRWDIKASKNLKPKGPGVLVLHTLSSSRARNHTDDDGRIRVMEILRGDPLWTRETVTLDSLTQGLPPKSILHPQMIMDVTVNSSGDALTSITLHQKVLERILDGRTIGLALLPLGPVAASFHSSLSGAEVSPRIHCNLAE
jgi:hypothetical protein